MIDGSLHEGLGNIEHNYFCVTRVWILWCLFFMLHLITQFSSWPRMWHRVSKPIKFQFMTFLFSHLLQNSFYRIQIPCSYWSCTCLISIIISSEEIELRVSEYSCHQSPCQPVLDYSAILLDNKRLDSVWSKPNSMKIGFLLYKLWQIHFPTELKNCVI